MCLWFVNFLVINLAIYLQIGGKNGQEIDECPKNRRGRHRLEAGGGGDGHESIADAN